MDKPTQEEFDTAREVLGFIMSDAERHTPDDGELIRDLEDILEHVSFNAEDYQEA